MIPLLIGLTLYAAALVFGSYKLGMAVSKMEQPNIKQNK